MMMEEPSPYKSTSLDRMLSPNNWSLNNSEGYVESSPGVWSDVSNSNHILDIDDVQNLGQIDLRMVMEDAVSVSGAESNPVAGMSAFDSGMADLPPLDMMPSVAQMSALHPTYTSSARDAGLSREAATVHSYGTKDSSGMYDDSHQEQSSSSSAAQGAVINSGNNVRSQAGYGSRSHDMSVRIRGFEVPLSKLNDEQRMMLLRMVWSRQMQMRDEKSRRSNFPDPMQGSAFGLGPAEQAMRLFVRQQLNMTMDNMIITDAKRLGNPIVYATEGFSRLCGFKLADIIGRNCAFLQGPQTSLGTVQSMTRILGDKRNGIFEVLNYRSDGTPFWNLVYVEPFMDKNGRIDKFVGVQVDVSEAIGLRSNRSALPPLGSMQPKSVFRSSGDVQELVDRPSKKPRVEEYSHSLFSHPEAARTVAQAIQSGQPSMVESRNASGQSKFLFVKPNKLAHSIMSDVRDQALQVRSFTIGGSIVGPLDSAERQQRVHAFRERRLRRDFSKRITYGCRKQSAVTRKRVKGRFVSCEDVE